MKAHFVRKIKTGKKASEFGGMGFSFFWLLVLVLCVFARVFVPFWYAHLLVAQIFLARFPV